MANEELQQELFAHVSNEFDEYINQDYFANFHDIVYELYGEDAQEMFENIAIDTLNNLGYKEADREDVSQLGLDYVFSSRITPDAWAEMYLNDHDVQYDGTEDVEDIDIDAPTYMASKMENIDVETNIDATQTELNELFGGLDLDTNPTPDELGNRMERKIDSDTITNYYVENRNEDILEKLNDILKDEGGEPYSSLNDVENDHIEYEVRAFVTDYYEASSIIIDFGRIGEDYESVSSYLSDINAVCEDLYDSGYTDVEVDLKTDIEYLNE